MLYDFNEIIERKNTNAMNTDGFREYIFHAPPEMKFTFKDDEFIRMWIADMEFATPPEVIQAIKDKADDRIFGYTKIFDLDYFNTFSRWTKKNYDWTFPKEQLVTSNGIIPALYELIDHICKPDEKILILTPSYAYFKHAADFNNIEAVCSNLIDNNGQYEMDFDDIEMKAKDEKVSLCIFCNPHNPTGRVWTEKELKKMGDICLDNGLWIISDEIHCDLLRTGFKHIPMAKIFPDSDKIITCMASSKTFNLAGLMISNIIIPNEELRKLWGERHYPFENPLSVAGSQAAYEHGGEWLKQLKVYLDENFEFTRQYLETNLPEATFKIPEATYLAWVNVKKYLPRDLEDKDIPLYFANNVGVLLEGGNMFVANSDGYIRLNVACPRATLEEGLKRISIFLNK